MFNDDEYQWLERRLSASGVDMLFYAVCCGALFYCFNALSRVGDPRIWIPAAALLGLASALELFAGLTPGKWLFGWSVRLPDGGRPPLWRLMLRGVLKLLPIAIFLASLRTSDPGLQSTLIAIAGTVAMCYFPAYYITLVRRRQNVFDILAGTAVLGASPTKE